MSENRKDSVDATIVDAVLDLGTTWAAYGLRLGRTALIEAARALDASGKTLGELASRIAPPAEVDSAHGGREQATPSTGDATQ